MVRYMRWVYAGWFVLITAAIFVQLYLAGYGVFGFDGLRGFDAHRFVGDAIGVAIMVSVLLAFAARVPWRATGINAALLVLMVIQGMLAFTGVQVVSALHVVNGVLILLVTLYLTRHALGLAAPSRTLTAQVSAQGISR